MSDPVPPGGPPVPDKKPSTNRPPVGETLAISPKAQQPSEDADDSSDPSEVTHGATKTVRFGNYHILKRLGQGGMGSVYLAEDTRLGRKVALKLCNRSKDHAWLERFRREARAAASLRHPNLCPVHESDVIKGVPYFTMALIEGPPLDEWAQARGGLSPREAALLVRKLALAMHHAHTRGVVHRDLKPSNVAVERGEPVIFDFGLALHGDKRVTVDGSVLGTPAYMSPEQVMGDIEAMGPACDIYSLGAILYELLTGRPPFEGPSIAVFGKVMSEEPKGPAQLRQGIDARLEEICLRCLAKNPAERWPDMGALAAALTEWAKSSGAGAAATKSPNVAVTTKPAPLPAIETRQNPGRADAPTTRRADDVSPTRARRGGQPKSKPTGRANEWMKPALIVLAILLVIVTASAVWLAMRTPSSERPASPVAQAHPEMQPAEPAAPARPELQAAAPQPREEPPAAPPAREPAQPPPGPPGRPPEAPPAPAGTIQGYIHDLDAAAGFVAVVTPGSRPVFYQVEPGVEVRLPQPPARDGKSRGPTAADGNAKGGAGKLPGYKGSLSDLQRDQFVTAYPGPAKGGRPTLRPSSCSPPHPSIRQLRHEDRRHRAAVPSRRRTELARSGGRNRLARVRAAVRGQRLGRTGAVSSFDDRHG
jgi:serine/threonine protein kinase